jgi:hypothetical protein
MLETHYIVVMQTPVDLDLGHELLLGAGFGEGSLGDDLGCGESLGLEVCEFIDLGETSLSQEFAPQILFDAHIAVEFYDFLFNYNLGIILHEIVLAA